MFLLVTGSSCAGKTTAAHGCRDLPRVRVHDGDEEGVPSDADTAWRQSNLRRWVRRAVDLHASGEHLLLADQAPLGELLAAPEVGGLPIAVCLLDVDDDTRRRRLDARDPGRWSPEQQRALASWGTWHRRHAADPRHQPEVITDGGAAGMRWDRWAHLTAWPDDQPGWSTSVIDTSGRAPADTRKALRRWVIETLGQRR